MDHDEDDIADDSPLLPSPNQFVFSVYRESPSVHANEIRRLESFKSSSSYKCRSCRKLLDNPILTCANCVNMGEFCATNHQTCSHKRREFLLKLLNRKDYEEFQQYSNNKAYHLTCCDRKFLLKKFRSENSVLQAEYQSKIQRVMEIHQMAEAIRTRTNRQILMRDAIRILHEQIKRKKQLNLQIAERMDSIRQRVQTVKKDIVEVNTNAQSAKEEKGRKVHTLTRKMTKLDQIRRERFDELTEYIFPIEKVAAIEDDLAIRIKDLLHAQLPAGDEANYEREEQEETASAQDYRYRIAQSCLPRNGDYRIENLLPTDNVDGDSTDPDSPRASLAHDFYQVLSGLSHACQLTNVIAFYLHINLPFRLHQWEFSTDNLTLDCLQANIAKLNANVISSCLSQGILIEFTDVTYTLENLLKLLRLERYFIRPRPVVYSQNYIDMVERDVNEISRTFITDYWFDDEHEKDGTDFLNSGEWEAIQDGDYIPSDQSVSDQGDSLPSTSSQQHPSMMSTSFDFLKNKGSLLLDSLVRNLKP